MRLAITVCCPLMRSRFADGSYRIDAAFEESSGTIEMNVREFGFNHWTPREERCPFCGSTEMLVFKEEKTDG